MNKSTLLPSKKKKDSSLIYIRQNLAHNSLFVFIALFLLLLLPQTIAKIVSIILIFLFFLNKGFFKQARLVVYREADKAFKAKAIIKSIFLSLSIFMSLLFISILWQLLFKGQDKGLIEVKEQLLSVSMIETFTLLTIAVLYEEFVFRLFILESFKESRVKPLLGILLSATAFASLHSNLGLQGMGLAFFSGILLGIFWYKFKALAALILGHLLYNSLVLFFFSAERLL